MGLPTADVNVRVVRAEEALAGVWGVLQPARQWAKCVRGLMVSAKFWRAAEKKGRGPGAVLLAGWSTDALFSTYSGQPVFQRETCDSFPLRGKESHVSREILTPAPAVGE